MADSGERPSKMRKLYHDGEVTSLAKDDSSSLTRSALHEENQDEREDYSKRILENTSRVSENAETQVEELQAQQRKSDMIHMQPNGTETDQNGAPERNAKPTVSKSQLKKIRKAEQWEAGKDYRRTKRREKLKEKKISQSRRTCRTANKN